LREVILREQTTMLAEMMENNLQLDLNYGTGLGKEKVL
jgi:hypothetical protein